MLGAACTAGSVASGLVGAGGLAWATGRAPLPLLAAWTLNVLTSSFVLSAVCACLLGRRTRAGGAVVQELPELLLVGACVVAGYVAVFGLGTGLPLA